MVGQHPAETGPAPQSGGAELRGAERYALLLRIAKLIGDGCEFLCVLRDASATGVAVKLFHPLPAGMPLMLEMPNGDRHPLQLVWENEGRAGFRFLMPVEIDRFISGPSAYPSRPVRASVNIPVMAVIAGRPVQAQICNISQQGALLTCSEHLAVMQRIRIEGTDLPDLFATVRWRREMDYGLVFENTFTLSQLAELLNTLHRHQRG